MSSKLLWGGRFTQDPSPELSRYSRSPQEYFELTPYDIAGSAAHAHQLAAAGILSDDETATILRALRDIGAEYLDGRARPTEADEDVHTFLERELVQRIGHTGEKIRAGRSRNDQTANDLRLYLRDQSRAIIKLIASLASTLIDRAAEFADIPCPGFTHLQIAQPIVFGHHLMAHVQPLLRDIQRFVDWDRRAAECPLGAAALAGSTFAMSPERMASDLGYATPFSNSIDAVGSRDIPSEFLSVSVQTFIDVSRLCEDLVNWSSYQFGWITLDDRYSTGSSIMPQKKNPDIAELTRGRAARVLGLSVAFLATVKNLPLAYDRDLIEDKFECQNVVSSFLISFPALIGMVATFTVNEEAMARQTDAGYSLATEVADYLVRQSVPFAEAHSISGRLVQYCEHHGMSFSDLSVKDLQNVDSRLEGDLLGELTVVAALEKHSAHGGTAPAAVREQIEETKARLNSQLEELPAFSIPVVENWWSSFPYSARGLRNQ